MNVIEDLTNKINEYFEKQSNEIQNCFDDIESIKEKIDFKVYLAQKILSKDITIENEVITYNYISKEKYDLFFNANTKLLYKNNPFFIIDINNFNLESFEDGENKYYSSLLLALNNNWNNINNDKELWFFIPYCQVDQKKIDSFVQFVLLINGETFHNPIEVTNNQFLENDVKNILKYSSKSFNQYQEIAYILSEYNHTKDILLKYLLLYNIIENFMYRKPIAEMTKNKFTIRDFKNLYKKVSLTEEKTLKELLKKIKNQNITTTLKLETYFDNNLNKYRELVDDKNEINKILKKMTLKELNELSFDNASKLIYYFRNSIIHNKETEFHITHTTLNSSSDFIKFFKDFLLPVLENIIYFLIFKENSIIDYSQNHLLLYEE